MNPHYLQYQLEDTHSYLEMSYVELMRAILIRALADLVENDKKTREAAWDWLQSSRMGGLKHFTFLRICEYLGLNSESIRRECEKPGALTRIKNEHIRRRVTQ